MSFVPRIELNIREDESILPVNQKTPWPEAFFVKFCVDHTINVLCPTRNFQSFSGIETQLCEVLKPVKIGPLSNTTYCPLRQFISHDKAERFFNQSLKVFCVPVDQGIEDIANKFSSEMVLMAFDASFNNRKMVPVVVELKVDLWLQYYPGIVKDFLADYVSKIREKGSRVDYSSVQQMKRIKLGRRSSMEECSICLEKLGGEEPALQLPCSHMYHQDCVRKWFKDSPSCPLCRSRLD